MAPLTAPERTAMWALATGGGGLAVGAGTTGEIALFVALGGAFGMFVALVRLTIDERARRKEVAGDA